MTKHVHASAGDHSTVSGIITARNGVTFVGKTFKLALGPQTNPVGLTWSDPTMDVTISDTERHLGLQVGAGQAVNPPARAYTLWARVVGTLETESIPAVNDRVVVD